MAKSMKVGGGGRFAALEKSISANSKKKGRKQITNPGAVAAAIGRKKYGNAKFQKMAATGRKRAK